MTARRHADELLSVQNLALQAAAAPIPLHQALSRLTEIVEQQADQPAVAAIMLVDKDSACLGSCIGPGLPPWYHEALEGVTIRAGLGTCAWAAACNEIIVTPDIAAAPSWSDFSDLPLGLGLKGAWSMPIRGSDGRVLGTFGTYFRECREPSQWERQVVEGLCQPAAWAIERKLAEEALEQSEDRLRSAMEAADISTWRIDLPSGQETRDTELNRILGLDDHAPEAGMPTTAFIHPDDQACVEAARQAAIDGAEMFDLEIQLVRPDGRECWVRDRGRVIRGPANEPLCLIGATVDITERKMAENALRRQDQLKDQFLAVLGHELRTPLAPLRSGLEVLASSAPAGTPVARVQAMMARQVDHLVRLVDDLLDMSRISRDIITLQRNVIDLKHVVSAAAELVTPLVDEREHRLIIEPAATPLTVDGDRERLTQVTANLLTNAARYMDPGGTIRLSTRIDNGDAVLQVTDEGYGIPPEQLPNLFNMFAQVSEHREKTGGGGLGIGLALSRRLVELHGGSMEAASRGPGLGSEFSFRLPLVAALGDHADAAATAGQHRSLPARRILVVDDNVDAATSLALVLELEGMMVQAVHDGHAALEAISSFAPDLVLLDIGLPGMDGYAVARHIRATSAGQLLTLCALTGWGQAEDKRRALEAGFDQHLTKPVALSQLLAIIDAAPAVSAAPERAHSPASEYSRST